MPRERLGSQPGMREGCSVWHADNVSLGESPPCAAAGSRVPGAGIAQARAATRGTKRANPRSCCKEEWWVKNPAPNLTSLKLFSHTTCRRQTGLQTASQASLMPALVLMKLGVWYIIFSHGENH